MLESVAASLLTRYLGDYVSGFDPKNLNFSMFSGEAELDNLQLRPEALDQLELPVTVKAGFLGKLKLVIPWKNLKSKPALVIIDRLFILAGPKPPGEYDERGSEERAYKRKLNDLEAHEILKQTRLERSGLTPVLSKKEGGGKAASTSTKAGDESFAMRMATRIVDNLQVEIRNIHVRYEDNVTDPAQPFVFGVTLESLSGQSVDETFRKAKWLENVSLVHKLVQLENFSLFFNPGEPFLQYRNAEELGQHMQRLIHTADNKQQNHWILRPVTAELQMVLNKANTPDLTIPKAALNFVFHEISLALEDKQFQLVTEMGERFSLYQRGLKYRKFRPVVAVRGNARQWWRFAIAAVRSDIREKRQIWEWDYISRHSRQKKEYIDLYRRAKLKKTLHESQQHRFDELQRELSYDDIIFFRGIADIYLKRDREYIASETSRRKAEHGGSKAGGGFFGGLASRIRGSDAHSEETATAVAIENALQSGIPIELTASDLAEIHAALDVGIISDEGEAPKEYVMARFQFSLSMGVIELLRHDSGDQLARLMFSEVISKYDMRNGGSGTFDAKLKSVHLFDLESSSRMSGLTPSQQQVFPAIVAPQASRPLIDRNDDGEYNLFELSVDIKPAVAERSHLDSYIRMDTQPLDIVFNPRFVSNISSFFTNTSASTLEDIEIAAAERMHRLANETQERVALAVANKPRIGLQMCLRAPTIIIPQDPFDPRTTLIVADLGTLTMTSRKSDDEAYDAFALKMSELRAFLTPNDLSNWRSPAVQHERGLHLIEPFSINLMLHVARADSPLLTNFRVRGELPSLQVVISDHQTRQVFSVFRAVASFSADETHLPVASERSRVTSRPPVLPSQLSFGVDASARKKRTRNEMILAKQELALEFEIANVSVLMRRDGGWDGTTGGQWKTAQPGSERATAHHATFADKQVGALVNLRIRGLAMAVTKRTFDVRVCGTLRSLIIEDKLNKFGEEFDYLVVSKGGVADTASSSLLSIEAFSEQRNSPGYSGVDTSVKLDFGALFMNANRETLVAILEWSDEAFSQPPGEKPVSSPVSIDHVQPKINVADNEQASSVKSLMSISAVVRQVNVTLNAQGSHLAFLSLGSLDTEVAIAENNDVDIAVRLGKLAVDDLSTGSDIYPRCIQALPKFTSDGKALPVIELIFTQKNASSELEDDIDGRLRADVHIQLRIASIRFFFLQRFVSEIERYVMEVAAIRDAAQRAAEAASRAAREAAAELVTGIDAKPLILADDTRLTPAAPRIVTFDIVVSNPYVIAPRSSSKTAILVADLGKITVKNLCYDRTLSNIGARAAVLDDITVKIENINLISTVFDPNIQDVVSESTRPDAPKILNDTTISVKVIRHIGVVETDSRVTVSLPQLSQEFAGRHEILSQNLPADIQIALDVSSVGLLLSISHVELLLGIFSENMLEGSGVVDVASSAQETIFADIPNEERLRSSVGRKTLTLTAVVRQVSIEIFGVDGGDLHAVFTPVVGIFINDLDISLTQYDNNVGKIVATLDEIAIEDIRMDASKFVHDAHRRLLAPGPSSAAADRGNPQLVVHFMQKSGGDSSANIIVEHPRLLLVPASFFAVQGAIMPMMEVVTRSLAKRADHVSTTSNTHSVVSPRSRVASDALDTHRSRRALVELTKAATREFTGTITIREPQICLIELSSDPTTRAFVLRSELVLGIHQTTVDPKLLSAAVFAEAHGTIQPSSTLAFSVNMQNIELARTRLGDNDPVQTSIVEPFGFDATVSMNARGPASALFSQETVVEVKVDTVHVMVAYRDVKLLLRILGGMQPSGRQDQPNGIEAELQPAIVRRPVPLPRELATVVFESFRFTLINDLVRAMPLVDLRVMSLSVEVSGWSSANARIEKDDSVMPPALLAFAQARLEADYFNEYNQRWEPLIEQWPFQVKFSQKSLLDGDATADDMHVFCFSDSDLNVNVTMAFLDTILRVASALSDDYSAPGKDDTTVALSRDHQPMLTHSHYIRNLTGVKLWYWRAKDSDEQRDPRELGNGEEEPLLGGASGKEMIDVSRNDLLVASGMNLVNAQGTAVREQSSFASLADAGRQIQERTALQLDRLQKESEERRKLSMEKSIALQIEGEFKPLSSVPVDRVGTFVLHMNPNDYRVKVIYDVAYCGGSKVLTVRSNVLVFNTMRMPIDVEVSIPKGSEHAGLSRSTVVLGPIAQSASIALPVVYAAHGYVRFRPSANTHAWSAQRIRTHKLKIETDIIECPVLPGPSVAPLSFLLSIEAGDATGGEASLRSLKPSSATAHDDALPSKRIAHRPQSDAERLYQRTLVLRSPIVVENLLPCAFSYRIIDLDHVLVRKDAVSGAAFSSSGADAQASAAQLARIIQNDRRVDVETGTAQSRQEIHVASMRPGQHVGLSLQIPSWSAATGPTGNYWSSVARLNGESRSGYLELRDSHQRILRIDVESRTHELSGAVTCVVYCKMWLLNQVGVPLLFAYDQEGKHVAAGQEAIEKRLLDSKAQNVWDNPSTDPREWYDAPSSGGDVHADMIGRLFLFSFPAKTKQRCFVKAASSQFSSTALNFEGRGVDGFVQVSERTATQSPRSRARLWQLAVSVGSSPDKRFWRSRVVTFAPRFVILNQTGATLRYRQRGISRSYILPTGDHVPLHWDSDLLPGNLQVTLDWDLSFPGASPHWGWSGGFAADALGNFDLPLPPRGQSGSSSDTALSGAYLVRVQVKLEGVTTFIIFNPRNERWPYYRITNTLDIPIVVFQEDISRAAGADAERQLEQKNNTPENRDATWRGSQLRVAARSSAAWGWPEPTAPHLLGLRVNSEQATAKIDKLSSGPAKRHTLGHSYVFELRAEGPVKTLLVRMRGRRQAGTEAGESFGEASNTSRKVEKLIAAEQRLQALQTEKPGTAIQYQFAGIGISFVNQLPEELLYAYAQGIDFMIRDKPLDTNVELVIADMQIANQLYRTPLPVLLAQHGSPRRDEESHKFVPFIHFSSVLNKENVACEDGGVAIDHYRYMSLLIQEIDLKVEEEFVRKLVGFVNDISSVMENQRQETLELVASDISPSAAVVQERINIAEATGMVYFELFHLNPILLYVTYLRYNARESSSSDAIHSVEHEFGVAETSVPAFMELSGYCANIDDIEIEEEMGQMMHIPTQILPNLDAVPLRLNALLLKHPFSSKSELAALIQRHYVAQSIRQFYKLLGSMDMLGNPLALVNNLGTGVYDFFYEPAKGITKSPADFGLGVAKGTRSLVGKSVFGIMNTTSKITGSASKGLAVFSMDKKYQQQRTERKIRESPKHAGEGAWFGVRDFGRGMFHGLTGIVAEPVKGAMEEGVGGFAKGAMRGVAGVAIKPVVGVLDVVEQTTRGIRNTAAFGEGGPVKRVRPPRAFHAGSDGFVLEPYDRNKAVGQEMLKELSRGRYQHEQYVFHAVYNDKVLLVTDRHLFLRRLSNRAKIWKENLADLRRDGPAVAPLGEDSLQLFFNRDDQPQRVVHFANSSDSGAAFHALSILLEKTRTQRFVPANIPRNRSTKEQLP